MRHNSNRLLLSSLPAFFAVFFLLLVLILTGSGYLSRETLKRESLIMATFISSALDRELAAAERVVRHELLDKTRFLLLARLNPTHNSYYSTYELSVMLRELAQRHPLIDSIYVYRQADRTIQTRNVASTLERFGDAAYLQAVLSEPAAGQQWSAARAYREFEGQSPASVVSIALELPMLQQSGGAVVLNVSTAALTELVGRLSDPSSTRVTIRDGDGSPLLASGPEGIGTDAAFASAHTGYTVQLGYREGILHELLGTLTALYVAAGCVLTALGALWMIRSTKRHYEPIQSILSRLERMTGARGSGHAPREQFGFLEQELERMIERATAYEQQHREHAAIRRRSLCEALLAGDYAGSPEEARRELRAHGWRWPDGACVLALAEIDDYDGFVARYGKRDQALLKFAIYNVVLETTRGTPLGEPWMEWVSPSRIAVLHGDAGARPGSSDPAALRRAAAWIGAHLRLSVTIAVAPSAIDPCALDAAYRQAQRLLRYKRALGIGGVLGSEQLALADDTAALAVLVRTPEAAAAYRMAGPGWNPQCEEWLTRLRGLLIPAEEIELLVRGLLYHIGLELQRLPEPLLREWRERCAPSVERLLHGERTLEALCRELRTALIAAAQQLVASRLPAGDSTALDEVRAHIDRHYADPELSLAALGDAYGFSDKALSRQFKSRFGVGFLDYVMQRRLEAAKRLLEQSAEPIGHIAGQVGYPNALSFTRAFKRSVGVTPADYRRA
ncbi:AraC family transcriptional regulator [Paenibacillus sp. IB182496]|uniref:AraC family transcriptional regulator n=1 Tax=Paenibacillus sabuli TaxID=2772509 RepID=A0A927GRS6_9BACL|nr:AraC family transcriptional regulator [Paenibacillus sabuli]MBD2845954.1 AraC family transcriptional regulator [Paenibacillus sabuli]